MTERRIAALFDLLVSAALLVALLVGLVRFFHVFGRPGLGVARYAYLPFGLLCGAGYAAFRAGRAYRRVTRDSPP